MSMKTVKEKMMSLVLDKWVQQFLDITDDGQPAWQKINLLSSSEIYVHII